MENLDLETDALYLLGVHVVLANRMEKGIQERDAQLQALNEQLDDAVEAANRLRNRVRELITTTHVATNPDLEDPEGVDLP